MTARAVADVQTGRFTDTARPFPGAYGFLLHLGAHQEPPPPFASSFKHAIEPFHPASPPPSSFAPRVHAFRFALSRQISSYQLTPSSTLSPDYMLLEASRPFPVSQTWPVAPLCATGSSWVLVDASWVRDGYSRQRVVEIRTYRA